jgi:hypothetical protein
MGGVASVCQPWTLRMLIWPEASNAQKHGGSVGRWQNGLRLDPSLELLVQPLDGVGAGFVQAVGDGTLLEPPFSEECFAARLNLLARRRVDHVVVTSPAAATL